MRIPQHFKTRDWQRFSAGLILGIIVGWMFFIVISGIAQERQLTMIYEQKQDIKQLKSQLKTWQEESNEKNEQLEQKLTVQSIKVTFVENRNNEISKSELFEIRSAVSEQLSSLIHQNIESVAENQRMIKQVIENKTYEVEKNRFRVKVATLVIYSTVKVVLNVEKV
ncbi:MAG TPA: sporulation membrane protein YtrI [Bacillales bacterium]|nr:sporulation membrane protein YtrI [Bacillales bacterium]